MDTSLTGTSPNQSTFRVKVIQGAKNGLSFIYFWQILNLFIFLSFLDKPECTTASFYTTFRFTIWNMNVWHHRFWLQKPTIWLVQFSIWLARFQKISYRHVDQDLNELGLKVCQDSTVVRFNCTIVWLY